MPDTNYLGLAKPTYSNTADVTEINNNMDILDAAAKAFDEKIGIIIDGNKTAYSEGVWIGQFAILKHSTIVDSGSTMLPDGLYKAVKYVPYNTVIDKTYLEAVPIGGFNALSLMIEDLKTQIISEFTANSAESSNVEIISSGYLQFGSIVIGSARVTIKNNLSRSVKIATDLPWPVTGDVEHLGNAAAVVSCRNTSNYNVQPAIIDGEGNLYFMNSASQATYVLSFAYPGMMSMASE